ncbi:hypothetical protein P3T76_004382 [Phytophthora citrophthora]|uniref:Uncharacterized protein n=1 Tax=Phytophthora citrophthora TaxID=4793 RepID=A0AAD9GTB9_9STRA|nr:hypothetical protein P3T76_004382 [Phytophthora citrophthora]
MLNCCMSSLSTFSVVQCVAKRTRQLERLLYMLESTAIKFQQVKSPHSTTDVIVLSPTTSAQVQKQYAKMLMDFLEKEKSLRIAALFADSIHVEVVVFLKYMCKYFVSYDEELQQLLVQVEDEELLRQRVDGIWEFLTATSINQDIIAMIRSCEGLWNDLLPLISSVAPLINTMREPYLYNPGTGSWSKPAEDTCSPVHPWPYRS